MRKNLLLFSFVLIYSALYSQDLIVTSNQDSINCQILMIGDGLMHYSTMKNNETIKSSIPLEEVLSSVQGYYSPPKSSYTQPRKKSDYAHFRIAAAGGYSRRLISSKGSSTEDSYKKPTNGFHYGLELNYYFNENIGIGINYYATHFKLKDDYSEKLRIQQVIPTFSTRIFDEKQRGGVLINIGVGYINYRDEYRWSSYYSGNSAVMDSGIGLLCSVGYDFPLSKMMAICLQASITSGKLTDINSSNGWGKINLSLGLRFAK